MKKFVNEIISLLRLNTGRTNYKVVLLCLVTATLFWFFNALNKDYTANIKYPISFLYDSDQYQEVKELPDDVLLNMSGVGWNLLRKSFGFKVEPIVIRLETPEMSKWIAGSSLPTAITDQVSDLQLNYVLTDTLYLDIDKRISKYIKIHIDKSSLDFEDGYTLSGMINITPDSIRLTGPEDILYDMGDTLLISISENSIDENYEDDVEAEVDNNELISRNPPTVEVKFDVETLENFSYTIPLDLIAFPSESSTQDTLIVVSGRVRSSLSSSLVDSLFRAEVNFNDISLDSTIIPKLTSYPDYIESVQLDSSSIKVISN